jgi:hypothetical protein
MKIAHANATPALRELGRGWKNALLTTPAITPAHYSAETG